MLKHDARKHDDRAHHGPDGKPKHPKGPKEREIAAALTAAAVQALAGRAEYHSLEDAAMAVGRVYEQMFTLITRD